MDKLFVTKAYLPPIEEYLAKISTIWENHILSNYGPLHQEFEQEIVKYLEVHNLHYVNNGTTALMLALNSLDKPDGEIITTPFTFIATSSAITWQKYVPVFVDINPKTFNIDEDKIEEKINEKTRAILAVHCFGYPCNIEKLSKIADKYHLPIIYDGAHTFGVKYHDKALLSYGDISICSMHATKVFHTIEGGLCVVNNPIYQQIIQATKNFGMEDGHYEYAGINAKPSEFHAAMGLCLLKHFDEIINYRKMVYQLYCELLHEDIEIPKIPQNTQYNYIYFPIVLPSEKLLLKVLEALNKENIFPKRYFYPCLNETNIYRNFEPTPIAADISRRVLCLPLDTYLLEGDIKRICQIINDTIIKGQKVYRLDI